MPETPKWPRVKKAKSNSPEFSRTFTPGRNKSDSPSNPQLSLIERGKFYNEYKSAENPEEVAKQYEKKSQEAKRIFKDVKENETLTDKDVFLEMYKCIYPQYWLEPCESSVVEKQVTHKGIEELVQGVSKIKVTSTNLPDNLCSSPHLECSKISPFSSFTTPEGANSCKELKNDVKVKHCLKKIGKEEYSLCRYKEFSLELSQVINGLFSVDECLNLEKEVFSSTTFLNYLLLDSANLLKEKSFKVFVDSVVYVGSACLVDRSREATDMVKASLKKEGIRKNVTVSKVIILELFHYSSEKDSLFIEVCIRKAMNFQLTKELQSQQYIYSDKEIRDMGVKFLWQTFKIFTSCPFPEEHDGLLEAAPVSI